MARENNLKARVYEWTLKLMRFIDQLPKKRSAIVIGNQLMRSGTSVGANYIEAQAASSRKDFANFLHHSLKSANESKFWLMLLRDSGAGIGNEVTSLLSELVEISNILGASLVTLKGKK